jgi:hypothetical protein
MTAILSLRTQRCLLAEAIFHIHSQLSIIKSLPRLSFQEILPINIFLSHFLNNWGGGRTVIRSPLPIVLLNIRNI